MNQTALKAGYLVALLLWAACTCATLFNAVHAFAREGRGPWGFYLLGALAFGALSKKTYRLLRKPLLN